MRILLVNDDGYRAEGIKALERVLSSFGHEIYVLAPSLEQSGKSHSMTLGGGRTATKYGPRHYHIDGTPADCIIYGLNSNLLGVEPDVVVSGINHGYNLSTDIIYSGTCGAARQAAFYGYKAIAISEDKADEYHFEATAAFLAEHMDAFLSELKGSAFININLPSDFDGSYEYASIGEIVYDDKFSIEPKGEDSYVIRNIGCDVSYHSRGGQRHPNDFEICAKGKASISYIELLPSCSAEHMERL